MMAFLAILSLVLPLAVLFIARESIIKSHKNHPSIWVGFYGVIVSTYIVLDNVTNPIILFSLLAVLVAVFGYFAYRAVVASLVYRKFYIDEAEGFYERHTEIASSKTILSDVALYYIEDYKNEVASRKPAIGELRILKALAANKYAPSKVLDYMITIDLPTEVLVALAGNPALAPASLFALAIKTDISPAVIDAIISNPNTTSETLRAIIGIIDAPYALIDGSSPRAYLATKAIDILKERSPELKEVDNRYIIATCSPTF